MTQASLTAQQAAELLFSDAQKEATSYGIAELKTVIASNTTEHLRTEDEIEKRAAIIVNFADALCNELGVEGQVCFARLAETIYELNIAPSKNGIVLTDNVEKLATILKALQSARADGNFDASSYSLADGLSQLINLANRQGITQLKAMKSVINEIARGEY